MSFDPSKPHEIVSTSGFNSNLPHEVVNQDFSDNETPADVRGRLVTKNFASNPETALKYFQQQNPSHDFVNHDGEIWAAPKGTNKYQPIDPNNNLLTHPVRAIRSYINNPSELVNDATDIGTDVAQGALDNAGGLLSGVATGAGTLGLGAAAGYAAGRGAVGAATEYGKQAIGEGLGLDDNINHGNAAIAGVGNAIMPVVGEQVIKPMWNGTKNVAIKSAARMGNYSEDVLRNLESNYPEVRKIADGARGIGGWLEDKVDGYKKAMEAGRNKVGSDMFDLVNPKINTNPVNLYATQQAESLNNPEILRNSYKRLGGKYLPSAGQDTFDINSPTFTVGDPILASKESVMNSKNLLHDVGTKANTLPSDAQAATDLSKKLRDTLVGNSSDPNLYEQKAKQYSEIMGDIFDNSRSKISDSADKARSVLASFGKRKTAAEKSIDMNFSRDLTNLANEGKGTVNFAKDAEMLQTLNDFSNPTWRREGHTIPAVGAGAAIGGLLGYLPTHNYYVGMGTGALGGIAGGAMVSPKAILAALPVKNAIENVGEKAAQGIYKNKLLRGDRVLYNLYNDGTEN